MKVSIIFLLVFVLAGCRSEKFKDVGDIPFDPQADDVGFELCNEKLIKQYYIRQSSDVAPGYKGEKRGLEQEILSQFSFPQTPGQNGYITIRFIVNCHGESGRYRIEEMNPELIPFKFSQGLSSQLSSIVKNLKNWKPRKRRNKSYDFYQYLTFKIENGQIVKIMP